MGPIDLLFHLSSFLAPALGVALGVAFAARLLGLGRGAAHWWAPVALNFLAGVAVLLAGLWFFGTDGKMATYAAMVVAVASMQWLAGSNWRR